VCVFRHKARGWNSSMESSGGQKHALLMKIPSGKLSIEKNNMIYFNIGKSSLNDQFFITMLYSWPKGTCPCLKTLRIHRPISWEVEPPEREPPTSERWRWGRPQGSYRLVKGPRIMLLQYENGQNHWTIGYRICLFQYLSIIHTRKMISETSTCGVGTGMSFELWI